MARFTDIDVINIGDLNGLVVDTTYVVGGGTLNGSQPTFNGAPLFAASYAKVGDLVHFRTTVAMTNITGFGTGQYYMTLPFDAKYEEYIRGGHLHDNSTNKFYTISAQTTPGSNVIKLWTTASNGDEVPFTSSVPFNLATADDFHVSGSYIAA